MRIVLVNLKGCFLRTMNKRMKVKMNLVMKDLTTTTTTITTMGNGYLDLMKRSRNESGGFLHSRKATDV